MSKVKLPKFLVIGAMKAGTTSFCNDLQQHSSIFFPTVKEPHTLLLDDVLSNGGTKKYASLFRKASHSQIIGEGSTGYSKYPMFKKVPARARQVLGSDLKIIYIIRDPFARSISHHFHNYRAGEAPFKFSDALIGDPSIMYISKYGMQLERWLEFFPIQNFLIIKFEDYIQDRKSSIKRALHFLGISVEESLLKNEKKYNVGEEERLPPKVLRQIKNRIARSQWFKRNIHPFIPSSIKSNVKKLFYVKTDNRPSPPGEAAITRLAVDFEKDIKHLSKLTGSESLVYSIPSLVQEYSRSPIIR